MRERDGNMDTVGGCLGSADDGWETVGNSLGRAPLGGSETEAWTSWTDGKLWEIAWELRWEPWEIGWGELRWEGARRKRGHRGRMENCGK